MARPTSKKPGTISVNGVRLTCRVCEHEHFLHREAQMNTAVASFFNVDWANPTADCYICNACGYVHWFVPQMRVK